MAVQQISSLTPMRGVAALLVMIHNFDSVDFFTNLSSKDYTFFVEKGYLWVDFFFLLSGFIMAHVYGPTFVRKFNIIDYREFVLARFSRIYPLHFFTLSLLVILSLVKLLAITLMGFSANNPPFGDDAFPTLVSNLLLLHSMNIHSSTSWNIPSWSISVEWYTYMIFPFFAGFVLKSRTIINVILFLSALTCLSIFIHLNADKLAATAQGGFVRCVISFVIGMTIYNAFNSGILQRFFSHDSVYLLSLLGAFILMHLGIHDMAIMGFMILLLAASACNTGTVRKVLNCRPLVYLGEISYTIYLMHMVVKAWFLSVWSALIPVEFGTNLDPWESAGTMLVFSVVVIGLSAFVFEFYERPARHIVRRSKLGSRFLQAK